MHKLISCSFLAIIFSLAFGLATMVLVSPLSRGTPLDQGFVVFMALLCTIIGIAALISCVNIATDKYFDRR